MSVHRDGPSRRRDRPFAVVAGGGTAGHAVPALAVARALVERGHPPSAIRFVGSARGLEARLVPQAGFPITLLPGRGIPRRVSLTVLTAAAGLVLASFQALVLLARWRPAVVLAVGGYASLPCALAAVVLRVPLVLQEQNSVPGSSNRLVGRFARAAAVAFPGTDLPRAVVTGRPVAPEMEAVDRSVTGRRRARRDLGVSEDRRLVGVTGGSLGAARINGATVDLVRRWSDRKDRSVYHVIGSRDYPTRPRPEAGELECGELEYHPVEYEARMATLLGAADVMVGRAGGWVAELAAAGVPSVLVPLPGAPGDHQTANGRALEQAGAALVLTDTECSGARLEEVLDAILADEEGLARMGVAARGVGRPGAAGRVADLVEAHARRSRRAGRPAGDRAGRVP